MAWTRGRFPLGEALTLEQLDADPYPALAGLREHEPVRRMPDGSVLVVGGATTIEAAPACEIFRLAAGS